MPYKIMIDIIPLIPYLENADLDGLSRYLDISGASNEVELNLPYKRYQESLYNQFTDNIKVKMLVSNMILGADENYISFTHNGRKYTIKQLHE